jgi:hypothetical protein
VAWCYDSREAARMHVIAIVDLFAEVNVIEDPDTRLGVWATKADAIVDAYYVPDK